jgi:hypothetical protein
MFRNINSFRALAAAAGVTHFAFGQRDQAPFCGHSDCVCASGGLGPPRDLSSLRSALSRGRVGQRFRMPRSVAGDGLRTAHVSREPARSGVVAVLPLGAALSDGLSESCAAQHSRRCQRASRLAHLCRLGTEFDSSGSQALRQITFGNCRTLLP